MTYPGFKFAPASSLTVVNNIITSTILTVKSLKMPIDYVHMVNLVATFLPKLLHNDIIIKPSPLHGNGVFATKNIPKNTIVTFYPPHALTINDTTHFFNTDSPDNQDFVSNFNKYFDEYSVHYSIESKAFAVGSLKIYVNVCVRIRLQYFYEAFITKR